MARRKHIPQRMCVACRMSQDKKNLVRIVRTPQGVFVDETGKLPGRGAYLHADPACWETGIHRSLEKSLRTGLSDADQTRLRHYWESHPDHSDQAQGEAA